MRAFLRSGSMSPPQDLDEFLDHLAEGIGRPARRANLHEYCLRLLEGMGIDTHLAAPQALPAGSARHQAQHHFIAKADWPDDEVQRRARAWIRDALEDIPDTVWLVEAVEIAKRGRHSVGVARQYGTTPGRHANCQIAIAVTLARRTDSLPLTCRLHLPEEWARNPERCRLAGVPPEQGSATRADIALQQLSQLMNHGFSRRLVFADSRMAPDPAFRRGLDALGLAYLLAIPASTVLRRGNDSSWTAGALAQSLPADAYRTIPAEAGDAGAAFERFAALRVTPGDTGHSSRECWLLVEHRGADSPAIGCELISLPATATLQELVRLHRTRRRLDSLRFTTAHKLQLAHYAGRGWRGFHHHASLALAMLAFITVRRWEAARAEPLPMDTGPHANGSEHPEPARETNTMHRARRVDAQTS